MKLVIYILSFWLLFVRFLVFDEQYVINNIAAFIISLCMYNFDKSIIVKASVFLSMTYFYNSLLNFDNSILGIFLSLFTIIAYYNKKMIWKMLYN